MASGSKGKTIAIAAIGAGVVGALLLTGKSASAAEPKAPKKTTTPKRVVLATKYAKLFGVPLSLVLATIRAQSANNANAYKANSRGGAWGYGQMTLATAQDINKHAARKHWATWDGTGRGLLDPAVNIAMTAYYLSQWWKRYQRHRLNWILAAYAYVLGPGTVKKALPDAVNGKMPSPLPATFAAVKKRFLAAMQSDSSVKAALAKEMAKPVLAGSSTLGIDDPLIWTPSAIKAEFERIRIVLDTVNAEVSAAEKAKRVTGAEWNAWYQTYQAGHKFVTTASNWWGSNVIAARKHETEAGKWRDLVASRGQALQGPKDLVRKETPLFNSPLGANTMTAGLAIAGVAATALIISAIKK